MSTLVASFNSVRTKLNAAALRADRDPKSVRLVAVSKSVDTDKVVRAHAECGQNLFGENRADELVRKIETCTQLGADLNVGSGITSASDTAPATTTTSDAGIEFHFIGPLQTNKVRKVVGRASLIHSVDSERLLRAIDARAKLLDERQGGGFSDFRQPVLIQVSISGEEAKQGIEPAALDALLHLANEELNYIQVNGLMTMAPFAPAKDVRWIFEDLRVLRDRSNRDGSSVSLTELSMGMTGDFEAAIEEGATLVRVGTALFAQ